MIVRRCSTKGAFEAVPEEKIKLDFTKIKNKFKVIVDLPMLIIVKCKEYDVTCYKNGKLLIKNCNSEESAKEVADEIYGAK